MRAGVASGPPEARIRSGCCELMRGELLQVSPESGDSPSCCHTRNGFGQVVKYVTCIAVNCNIWVQQQGAWHLPAVLKSAAVKSAKQLEWHLLKPGKTSALTQSVARTCHEQVEKCQRCHTDLCLSKLCQLSLQSCVPVHGLCELSLQADILLELKLHLFLHIVPAICQM